MPERSTGVIIGSNAISNLRSATGLGNGIILATGSSTGATIHDNVLIGNAQAGLNIMDRNTNNIVRDNVALNNTVFGIRIQGTGSTNNTFEDNRMSGNGTDARDDTDPMTADGIQLLSTWTDNKCTTDLPVGAICTPR